MNSKQSKRVWYYTQVRTEKNLDGSTTYWLRSLEGRDVGVALHTLNDWIYRGRVKP